MWETVSLAGIARNAGTDDVFPGGLSAAVPGQDMIEIEIGPVKVNAAILAGVLIALKDVVSGELDFFFGKSVKKTQNDDSRDPDS
jgi:hypothetical protein